MKLRLMPAKIMIRYIPVTEINKYRYLNIFEIAPTGHIYLHQKSLMKNDPGITSPSAIHAHNRDTSELKPVTAA